MQNVSFQTVDSLTITGTLAMPNQTRVLSPGVIIFHGMRGSMDKYIPLINKLAENGIAGLAISMRAHGESEGDFYKNTVEEAVNDSLAAFDFLVRQTGIDANRIGLVGSSVGAILAAMTVKKRHVKSLLLRAPAAYTKEMMQISMADTTVNELRQFHEISDLGKTPAGSSIEQFDGSLLVVASGNDATIPLAVSQGYVDIANNAENTRLAVIEGATHTLTEPSWEEEFAGHVVNWFGETL